jgi:hypothetical protein
MRIRRSMIAACVLTAALLLPHAPLRDIVLGIGLGMLLIVAGRSSR